MAKASDNLFPKVLLTEGTAPTSPAAGNQGLFIDSADHKLKRVNSSGAVTTIEGGGTGAGDTSWIAPTLQNSWVNYGSATWADAGYRKDSAGVVHLQGLVKNGTASVAIFTLPAGYRPAKQKPFLCESSSRPSGISVNADGTVVLSFGAGGSGFYVYLDAISFVADQ